jgi:nitrogen fixation protein NifX
MRVAFTSSDGERVDEHFGQATRFHVWEVGPDTAAFVEIVGACGGQGRTHGHPADHSTSHEDDRVSARADAVQGCALLYTEAIGGPAAAKLVARRIHPIKTGRRRALPADGARAKPEQSGMTEAVPIGELVEKLQGVLRGKPPPWLRKALGMAAAPAATASEDEDA